MGPKPPSGVSRRRNSCRPLEKASNSASLTSWADAGWLEGCGGQAPLPRSLHWQVDCHWREGCQRWEAGHQLEAAQVEWEHRRLAAVEACPRVAEWLLQEAWHRLAAGRVEWEHRRLAAAALQLADWGPLWQCHRWAALAAAGAAGLWNSVPWRVQRCKAAAGPIDAHWFSWRSWGLVLWFEASSLSSPLPCKVLVKP